MDVTQLFKACVKTVRLRNKNLPTSPNVVGTSDPTKKPMTMAKLHQRDEQVKSKVKLFVVKAKNIIYQLTQLRNFLIENRAAYMKFACHLKRSAQMTDDERDLIDSESEKILNICNSLIDELKLDPVRNMKMIDSKQLMDHMDLVIDQLMVYHKNVTKIFSDQKKYRVQRDLETYKLLKLNSDRKKSTRPTVFGNENDLNAINKRKKDDRMACKSNGNSRMRDKDVHSGGEINSLDAAGDGDVEGGENVLRNRKNPVANKLSLDDEIITNHNQMMYEETELSAEDIQMFESENTQLLKELKGLSDEVEQIEKNVVDIANLQEIFSEKVTLQKHDIDRISNTVVGTTENVRDANEQIKQAIQRNAGLRVYVLFFLIVMSFSLLFLDWYND